MISTSNVTLRVGKKALFEDVSIKFIEGNCYGLIGANGAGKSTFLRILSGQLEPTNGEVIITPGQRLSFLQQDHFKYDAYPVLDTVIMGNARLYEIMKEKEAIYMKEDFTDEDGIKASELEAEFASMNGWEAESDASTLLNGLGIGTELHYETMKNLAADLQGVYKENFDVSNLYKFKQFYEMYSDILDTASLKSFEKLTWSHYRVLLQVKDDKARTWYEKEAAEQTWSVKTLQRNISSQYYYRMLSSQNPSVVEAEMKELTADYQNDKLEFIKNPIIAEFLGMTQNTDFTESKLEKYIITNLQSFIMELGKGYAFVARQQHIRTEKEDYYIDLVFYNYILKCFVLFDLKTQKITHQDVGQMDMYIRMYDELKRGEGDNPTIGVVLCSDTDEDIARYSVLHDSDQLFMSKYCTYLQKRN